MSFMVAGYTGIDMLACCFFYTQLFNGFVVDHRTWANDKTGVDQKESKESY